MDKMGLLCAKGIIEQLYLLRFDSALVLDPFSDELRRLRGRRPLLPRLRQRHCARPDGPPGPVTPLHGHEQDVPRIEVSLADPVVLLRHKLAGVGHAQSFRPFYHQFWVHRKSECGWEGAVLYTTGRGHND